MSTLNYLLLSFSLIGLVNAIFLHWQYVRFLRTGKKMYCFMGEDCSQVVGSKYGATLGLKNEKIGIFYYVTIGIFSLWNLSFYHSVPATIESFILAISGVATLFSVYLFIVQAFILKKYCSWCLIAIFTNLLIFVLLIKLVF